MSKKVFPKHPLVKFEPKPGNHEFPYPGKQPSKNLSKNHYPIISQNHVEGLIANVEKGKAPDPILLSVKVNLEADSDNTELKTRSNTGLYRPKGFVLPEGWQMEKVYRKTSSVCDVYYWPPLVEGERRRKCRSRIDLRKKLGDNFINWDLFRYKSGEYPVGEVVRNANFELDNYKKVEEEKPSNNGNNDELEKDSDSAIEAANRKRSHPTTNTIWPSLLPASSFKKFISSYADKKVDLSTPASHKNELEENTSLPRPSKEASPLREPPRTQANPQKAKQQLSDIIHTALLEQIGPLNDGKLKGRTPQQCIKIWADRIVDRKIAEKSNYRSQLIPSNLINFWYVDEEKQIKKVVECRQNLCDAMINT